MQQELIDGKAYLLFVTYEGPLFGDFPTNVGCCLLAGLESPSPGREAPLLRTPLFRGVRRSRELYAEEREWPSSTKLAKTSWLFGSLGSDGE
jgi:hypothetical protein